MKHKSSPSTLFAKQENGMAMKESNDHDSQDVATSNLAAQQAAVEAISVSRSSLTTTLQQGEQLNHCNDLRLRNEYIMKKSERLIRGMTWSGWIKNLVTKDIAPPTSSTSMVMNNNLGVGTIEEEKELNSDNYARTVSRSYQTNYDDDDDDETFKDVPTQLLNQASLVTNYASNVLLLKECQSIADYEACLDICDRLYNIAQQSLQKFQWQMSTEEYEGTRTSEVGDEERKNLLQWEKKLMSKLERNQHLQSSLCEKLQSKFYAQKSLLGTASPTSTNNHQNSYTTDLSDNTNSPMVQSKYQEQEEHLNILSSNVQELMHNSTSMSMIIDEQNSILDSLNDGTDDLLESTKMVSRKADRIRYRSVSMKILMYTIL